ncbi:MAG: Na+:solute symporter [Deltaproteobacteria bacterium]|nr:Na+:solute symporter [Deltaproteobacteria bacterium]
MSTWDWLVVGSYIAISLGIGVFFSRRAGRSVQDYFLSNRSLPWWLIGSSMVATTFAADTPLAVTELVREEGIWKNWFWWALAISHVLAAIVFSRLWRRSGVLTDNELIELRYGGKKAAFLRGFKACYFSTLYNFIVMGWVTAAMSTVLSSFIDIPMWTAIAVCMLVAIVYSMLGGFWGVVVTDLVQFIVAMVGSVVFAVLAVDRVGGLDKLVGEVSGSHPELLQLIPGTSAPAGTWATFTVFVLVLWWSSHNADGGGYIIQRMMSARDERHAVYGTLWFALAHYVLRVWPWVVVALVSVVLLPEIGHREAYPEVMCRILPAGLRGLFVAVFLAAFMSTIDTHLNWGASYVVNDLYRRFLKKEADEKHYVRVSRIVMVMLGLIAALVAFFLKSISAAWIFVWSMGAGIGAVLILRWFWWRINAWSEIAALSTSVLMTIAILIYESARGPIEALVPMSVVLPFHGGLAFVWTSIEMPFELPLYFKALIVVGSSICVWLPVTLLTRPETEQVLDAFYRRIRPGGAWKREARRGSVLYSLVAWLGGVALVYGGMFLLGSWVLRQPVTAAWSAGLTLLGLLVLVLGMRGISRVS